MRQWGFESQIDSHTKTTVLSFFVTDNVRDVLYVKAEQSVSAC